jgi:hypothetical protein
VTSRPRPISAAGATGAPVPDHPDYPDYPGLAGRPLADLITANPLPAGQAITLILDLIDPLSALHRRGLVHARVSSANIMVLDDGSARLIDLGRIGQSVHSGQTEPSEPLDQRRDLYDLGVVLFECLTGTLPSMAATTDPRAVQPGIGDPLAALVTTLLAEKPDEGYQSGEALATDLRRLLDDPSPRFEQVRPRLPGRLRRILTARTDRTDRARSSLDLVLAEMDALTEQGDLGEAFDEVAARFFAAGLRPFGMNGEHRAFLVLHARGRLAQCRQARSLGPAEGSLILARAAVRRLRAVADTPLLRSAHQQCRAELHLLEGDSGRALRLLAKLATPAGGAPLLDFEIARTSARALFTAGHLADGQSQLDTAFGLAQEQGWLPRLRALDAEFGLRSSETTESLRAGSRAARAVYRQRELAEMLRPRPVLPASLSGPERDEELRREQVLRELVRVAERTLPAERTWLIRPASRTWHGNGPSRTMFGAELPAPGSCCELIYDQDLRALAMAGRALLGGPDVVAPPQLRRLLGHASSWLLVPLREPVEQFDIGILVLSSGQADAFTPVQAGLAELLAGTRLRSYLRA